VLEFAKLSSTTKRSNPTKLTDKWYKVKAFYGFLGQKTKRRERSYLCFKNTVQNDKTTKISTKKIKSTLQNKITFVKTKRCVSHCSVVVMESIWYNDRVKDENQEKPKWKGSIKRSCHDDVESCCFVPKNTYDFKDSLFFVHVTLKM
jgi:hypothetical protein